MRLVQCNSGDCVKIIDVDAGYRAEMNLVNLGISIGNKVKVGKKSPFRGPLTVICNGTEIAIGYGLAEKIIVEVS